MHPIEAQIEALLEKATDNNEWTWWYDLAEPELSQLLGLLIMLGAEADSDGDLHYEHLVFTDVSATKGKHGNVELADIRTFVKDRLHAPD